MLRVDSVGVNNLPAKATEALAELFGPIPELLDDAAGGDAFTEDGSAPSTAEAVPKRGTSCAGGAGTNLYD